jgi:putative colanic acid biosynthesis UDP-glucose lipid carrier transferase
MVSSVEYGATAPAHEFAPVDLVSSAEFLSSLDPANDPGAPVVCPNGIAEAREIAVSLAIKRACDIVIAGLLLILLSPLLLLIALAIRLDSNGPVIFVQQRLGRRAKPFGALKFRTMHVTENGNDVVQCTPDDTRVTRLGSFLRRSCLDELPQLWNVLLGQMSLVGPRPHPVSLDIRFAQQVTDYYRRYSLRPGITGLAQVRGYRGPVRSKDALQARVQSDFEYLERRSLFLDLVILVATFPAVIIGGIDR